MRVLVVSVSLVFSADIALQPMNGEINLGEFRCSLVLLVTVECDLLHRVLTFILNEVAGLHKHASRTACGVHNDTVVGLYDTDYGLDDRRWGKELAVVVSALLRELRKKIFVDTAEHVTRCCA